MIKLLFLRITFDKWLLWEKDRIYSEQNDVTKSSLHLRLPFSYFLTPIFVLALFLLSIIANSVIVIVLHFYIHSFKQFNIIRSG
jgi:hypothetical protein